MEKAVGEVFGFNDVKLQVEDIGNKACCDGGSFDECEHKCCDAHNCAGPCHKSLRSDGKDVVFVEVNNDKEE